MAESMESIATRCRISRCPESNHPQNVQISSRMLAAFTSLSFGDRSAVFVVYLQFFPINKSTSTTISQRYLQVKN
jgi:hypothetical protein